MTGGGWLDMLGAPGRSGGARRRRDYSASMRRLGPTTGRASRRHPDPELAELLPAAPPTSSAVATRTDRPTAASGRRRRSTSGVSNPITSDLRAAYVIIESDRHGRRVVHRHVAYDHDAVVQQLARSDHPQAEYIAASSAASRSAPAELHAASR
jgi:hypothetical protein